MAEPELAKRKQSSKALPSPLGLGYKRDGG